MLTEYEKMALDDIDDEPNSMIFWYLLSRYSVEVKNNIIIGEVIFERIKNKIINKWNDIESIYKKYLTINIIMTNGSIQEYPKNIDNALHILNRNFG